MEYDINTIIHKINTDNAFALNVYIKVNFEILDNDRVREVNHECNFHRLSFGNRKYLKLIRYQNSNCDCSLQFVAEYDKIKRCVELGKPWPEIPLKFWVYPLMNIIVREHPEENEYELINEFKFLRANTVIYVNDTFVKYQQRDDFTRLMGNKGVEVIFGYELDVLTCHVYDEKLLECDESVIVKELTQEKRRELFGNNITKSLEEFTSSINIFYL